MGRRLRTDIPSLDSNLQPTWTPLEAHRRRAEEKKLKTENNYNRHHRARTLPELHPQERVWITDQQKYAMVKEKAREPRSYWLDVEGRSMRRNRKFLVKTHNDTPRGVGTQKNVTELDPWEYVAALNLDNPSLCTTNTEHAEGPTTTAETAPHADGNETITGDPNADHNADLNVDLNAQGNSQEARAEPASTQGPELKQQIAQAMTAILNKQPNQPRGARGRGVPVRTSNRETRPVNRMNL